MILIVDVAISMNLPQPRNGRPGNIEVAKR